MIIDTLDQAEKYYGLHPYFKEAFLFLRKNSFSPGRIEIEKGKLMAISEESQGREKEQAPLEAHRKYVDIQCLFEGEEEIGWRPLPQCKKIFSPYLEEKDILFFSDAPLFWLKLVPYSFALFFPEDAHAPLVGRGKIRKTVMKVALL